MTDGVDTLIEVYFHSLATFARTSELFRDEFGGVGVHLFKPDSVAIDFSLDVTVGRATYSHSDGAAGSVSRQSHDAYIVSESLSAKLCAKPYFLSFGEQFLLKVDVAEGASCLVAGSGQRVVELDRSKFNGEQVVEYLNKKSGILGISGVSSDMRDINSAAEKGNERAKLIVPMLSYRIKKYIGSYAAAMGGVDAIVFTGGIGENQDDLRELSLEDMDFLGIQIDKKKNASLPRGTVEKISSRKSKVAVYRIPTNEELVIARDTMALSK